MALLTDHDELIAAWRALLGAPSGDGWRTIEVAPAGRCRARAGRHYPGDEEAFLVGFSSIRRVGDVLLPQGQGFEVSWADLGSKSESRSWIALCKEATASLELFAMMADDVKMSLTRLHHADDSTVLQAFLSRIRAWQEFMRRGSNGRLSPDDEIGLFGEIEVLGKLIEAGLPVTDAIEAWKGPIQGLHDFVFGAGALEVKSTASSMGFPARIGSLAQLDDSFVRPLFLAGIRLSIVDSGKTLAGKIEDLRNVLRNYQASLERFDVLLLRCGFLDAHAETYTRRFKLVGTKLMLVSEGFPRLTASNVPVAVRRASYELDLDLVPPSELNIVDALAQMGVTL